MCPSVHPGGERLPISDGVERKKVPTSSGRYYSMRIAAQRRKKVMLIQGLRRKKGTHGLRTSR